MTMFRFDAKFHAALVKSRNMLIPWYLMASYLYYVRDESLLSDHVYDALCETLDEEWDSLTHMHKHLVSRVDLAAGTRMSTEYPLMVKGAACALMGIEIERTPLGLYGEMAVCAAAMDGLKKSCAAWRLNSQSPRSSSKIAVTRKPKPSD